MPTVLFIAYLLLVHLGIVFEMPILQWLALQTLFAAILLAPLKAGRLVFWWAWACFAALTAVINSVGDGIYALYLPPLALTGLACAAFARSLRAGAVPLITQIATAVHGPPNPALARHTRQVTQLWVVVLALLFLITLLLTLSGRRTWWSVFTNAGSYLVMGLLFVGEFVYRRWRFPEHDRDGFIGHLRRVARSGVRFR